MDDTEDHALELSGQLASRLRELGWSCATAESCTGGLISSWITALAGSSDYFMGGVIAYSNDAKVRLLGVQRSTLERAGAVSTGCALEMAGGARRAFDTHVGISSTGIAGPGGATTRKPVGLIYIAVSTPTGDEVRELRLGGDRRANIRESAIAALDLTLNVLQAHNTR